jgi:hypothetical protein
MPDIVMIGLPAEFRNPQLPHGPYYPILIETIAEQNELETYLKDAGQVPSLPDLLDARPWRLAADHITVAHYGPPTDGWPYVLLCRWPPDLAAAAPHDLRIFVRGVFTIELFENEEGLERASDTLLALLKTRRQARVEIILPDWSAVPGKAPH